MRELKLKFHMEPQNFTPQEEIHFQKKTHHLQLPAVDLLGGGLGWIFIAQTINHTHFDGSLLLAFLAVFWGRGAESFHIYYLNGNGGPEPIVISLAITNPYNWPKINGFAWGEKPHTYVESTPKNHPNPNSSFSNSSRSTTQLSTTNQFPTGIVLC